MRTHIRFSETIKKGEKSVNIEDVEKELDKLVEEGVLKKVNEKKLNKIAIRRTELNNREMAIVKIFNLKNDMMSKWLSEQIEWDILERILIDIRNELKEQSKIINRKR